MLRDVAYQRFKEQLFSGKIRPGEFLSQQELSNKLDVPLGPIREALKKLEAEHLVELVKQRGIQVCYVDLELIKNAYQLREILEMAALEHFVRNASDEEIAHIKKVTLAAQRRLNKDTDAASLAEVEKAENLLHFSMVRSLNNQLFENVYELNFDKIKVIRLQATYGPIRGKGILREHLAVIRACEKRDLELAKSALQKHLSVSGHRAVGLDR